MPSSSAGPSQDHEPNPLRTRADVNRLMLSLWAPLRTGFERDGASVTIGTTGSVSGRKRIGLETFVRPLWGVASLHAGGGTFADWDIFRRGLKEGTDRSNARYWGDANDFDQRFVEMAAIAFALLTARDQIWEPLSPSGRKGLVAWLAQINRHPVYDCNWLFFRVLVNRALAAVGAPADAGWLREDLDRIGQFHRGEGWYSDGERDCFDYYGPMAFHFYGLICAGLGEAGGEAPLRAELTERARLFAPQFAAWFAPDGSALPYGRSLTYRLAQGAFWGALAFAGVEALPWGVVKGLYLRHLRWWLGRDILSESGLLTIGYGYANSVVGEAYIAPGSPYWAMKSFLPLALPDTHPFWTAAEIGDGSMGDDEVVRQPRPRFLVCRDAARGHVFALSSNRVPDSAPRHAAEKYAKFAYSTAFAFNVPIGGNAPENGAGDSMLLLSDDGRDWRGRGEFEPEALAGDELHSRWNPWPDVTVDTWLVPAMPGHVRVHRIRTKRRLRGFEGGFPLPYLDGVGFGPVRDRSAGLGNSFGTSIVCDLLGIRSGQIVRVEPNTNLLHPLTAVPGLIGDIPEGETWLFAGVVGLPGEAQFGPASSWCYSLGLQNGPQGPQVLLGSRVVFDCSTALAEAAFPKIEARPLNPVNPAIPVAGSIDRLRARLRKIARAIRD